MSEDDFHRAYGRSLCDVIVGRVTSRRRRVDGPSTVIITTTSSKISTTSPEKNLRGALTCKGFIEYHNDLYGDAARGCHHRGNGPDARERTIFVIRQRLGVLINEGPRRNPWGYRGGACRSDPVHVTRPHGSRQTDETYRVHIFRRRRLLKMAAKKKAAKKPAKKAAKKSSKKK